MGTCPPGTCPGGCPGGSCPPRNLSGGKFSPQEFVHGYGGKLSSHAIYQVIFLTGTRVGHCISSALWNVRGGIEYYSNSREAVWSCLCKRYWYQPATVEKSPCRNSDWEFAQSCTLHSHCTAEHWRSQTLSHEQGRGSKTPITLWFTDFFSQTNKRYFSNQKGGHYHHQKINWKSHGPTTRWFGQCPKENVFFLLMSSLLGKGSERKKFHIYPQIPMLLVHDKTFDLKHCKVFVKKIPRGIEGRQTNIARGTTDPGYRVYNLSYLSS